MSVDRKPHWVPLAVQVRGLGFPWVSIGGLQAAPLTGPWRSTLVFISANDG